MKTRWRDILPLCGAYSLATAVFNIAPLLIGALVTVLGLLEEAAGLIMTLELVAISVVAFCLAPWGMRFSSRTAMVWSIAIVLVAQILSARTNGYAMLIALRMLAGVGCGLLLLAVNTLIAASDNSVRLYGIVVVATTVIGAMLLATIPMLIQQFGMAGVYGMLAVLCVLTFAMVAVNSPSTALESHAKLTAPAALSIPRLRLVVLMTTVFLVQITQSGFYSFSERFGVGTIGLTPEDMGVLLAIGYLGAIPGSAAAAWIGYRYGRLKPLIAGLVLFAVAVNVAVFANDSTIFRPAFVAFNFFYFFCIPYQLGICADVDPSGRVAGAGIGVFFFGLACGPFLGGYLVGTHGYSSLPIGISIAVALGIGAYTAITRRDIDGVVLRVIRNE